MNEDPLQAPVVLVHGILGFDQLTLGGLRIAEYFRRIPEALREAGHNVPPAPKLNTAGSIAERAADLEKYLNNPTNSDVFGKAVHLVAHSMGGLDSRHMLTKPEMARRVLSLTTISTPHHGSPIADLVIAGTNPALNRFVEHLGVNVRGISDLTTASCQRFNQATPEHPGIRYFAVAGRFSPLRPLGIPLGILGLTHDLIHHEEGDNDGMVSVRSATFGQDPAKWTFLGNWEGNHFRMVNWGTDIIPSPTELLDDSICEKYKSLVARIKRP